MTGFGASAPGGALMEHFGFTADNVADAIQTMRPYAVDLSSSVEESPGVKDFDKLAAFFDAFDTATEAA